MEPVPRHKFDIYTELCPASSVAIIGSGVITVTMGEMVIGAAIVLSGIAVGLAGPIARSVQQRKISRQRRRY